MTRVPLLASSASKVSSILQKHPRMIVAEGDTARIVNRNAEGIAARSVKLSTPISQCFPLLAESEMLVVAGAGRP